MMRSRKLHTALVVLVICCVQTLGASRAVAGQKFRADEWVTECDSGPGAGAPDCSITVPFWQTRGVPKGSFALVVMLQTGNMGIVGEPFPTRAVLRIDKNPPIECREARYCVFPSMQALAALKQLKTGLLVLIQSDPERVSGGNGTDPRLGLPNGIAEGRRARPSRRRETSRGFYAPLLLSVARLQQAGRARQPIRAMTVQRQQKEQGPPAADLC
jgi:hypothetical protein